MMKGILLLFILTGGALAQAPTPPKPPTSINVTEIDRVKAENIALKISALEAEINTFVMKFEKDYPGWTINVKTQQVYQKPEPVAPMKKEDKK